MGKITYFGEKVFVGIDVHKKTYTAVCVHDNCVIKRATITASPQGLVEFLQRHFHGVELYTAYEAGFSGFVLHRYLEWRNVKNLVVHPAGIEVEANRRVKTDKRDATRIALQLAAGRLRGVFVPSMKAERRRLLTRSREQLLRNQTRLKNQIKMKLHYLGLIDADDDKKLSQRQVRRVILTTSIPELRVVLQAMLENWRNLTKQIREIEGNLYATSGKEVDPVEEKYLSTNIFGNISARVLAAEVGDLQQFPSVASLSSYTGLTPGEHSSGARKCSGSITRQGNSRLRHILVQAAWRAIKKNQALAEQFNRIAEAKDKNKKKGKCVAIVAVARRMIIGMRAAFRDNVEYSPGLTVTK